MSAHAEVATAIKSQAILDRTLKNLKCAVSRSVTNAYIAGRQVSGQQFTLPGHHRGEVVAELTTGKLHLDSDYRASIPAFVDAYSIAALQQEAENAGYTHQLGTNAQGEQYVEVFY